MKMDSPLNKWIKSGISGDGNLCFKSCTELAAAYSAGSLSPVAVTRAALERADLAQSEHNAFTRVFHEEALAAAMASEARWHRGVPLSALDGVPATIKDIVLVQDEVTRFGSTLTPNEPARQDAPAVAQMRRAGLVFLGLTTTPEFGWKAVTDGPLTGVTTNPFDKRLTPGGSSGGAAVAAVVGAGVFHLGSDGGGSIRIPASFTGICGIKPTFGRVPAYPVSAFGTMAHIGPMTRRSGDLAAMLRVISGRNLDDWYQGEGVLEGLGAAKVVPRGLKIGVWRKPPIGKVEPAVAAGFEAVLKVLAEAGAELLEFELPMADDLYDIFIKHWYSGAAARFSALGVSSYDGLDPGFVEIVEAAGSWSAVDYVAASGKRAVFGIAMDKALSDLDFVISPGCSILPFAAGQEVPPGSGLGRWVEWAGFSFPINLSQQPAAVVPSGRTASGLPMALQIIGARGKDARVLALAQWWEESQPNQFI
jgi:aspartyl-tRNA(Asn)/glutamyl-tRNA(Gln) amidotransferase subunit A